MTKFNLLFTILGLVAGLAFTAPSAFAQNSPGGDMKAPKLQPKGIGDQPLPAAIPGVGDQSLPTSQSVAKQQSGDPTAQLFTAINASDYNSAQDAISRGADLNAQNTLGETPIDLSVALNRNSITFLLLAARNDSGDDTTTSSASAAPVTMAHHATPAAKARYSAVPARLIEKPSAAPAYNPGTPNSSAGFLGFNH